MWWNAISFSPLWRSNKTAGYVQFSRDPRIEIYFPNPNIIVFLGKNFWKIRLALSILLYRELMTFYPVMKVRSLKVRFFFKHSRYWAYFEANYKENTIKGHLGSFKVTWGHWRSDTQILKLKLLFMAFSMQNPTKLNLFIADRSLDTWSGLEY